jgi:peptidoglycan-associated lipoprotein
MRLRGDFGRAYALVGVVFVLAACSGQGGQPQQYELGAAAAAGSVEDFAANAGDVVYFDADSAALSQSAQVTLRKQVQWLNQHPEYRVTVEGHADEWGTRQHNLALGAQRAIAVKSFLARAGLGAARIQTVSFGKEKLVADCSALSCRAKNRRARTVLTSQMASR